MNRVFQSLPFIDVGQVVDVVCSPNSLSNWRVAMRCKDGAFYYVSSHNKRCTADKKAASVAKERGATCADCVIVVGRDNATRAVVWGENSCHYKKRVAPRMSYERSLTRNEEVCLGVLMSNPEFSRELRLADKTAVCIDGFLPGLLDPSLVRDGMAALVAKGVLAPVRHAPWLSRDMPLLVERTGKAQSTERLDGFPGALLQYTEWVYMVRWEKV